MDDLVKVALSRYGSSYRPEFADACEVEIPKKANWCGVFIGWCLTQLSEELPPNPQVARSYLKIGEKIDTPEMGDIVVFWRESRLSWKGHVSIFIRHDKEHIYCLGGNQAGMVQITKYSKKRILDFRRI